MDERTTRPGYHEFSNTFLIIQAKGLKLDGVKSEHWNTIANRLKAWRSRIFNVRYLDEETTFVDISKATVPDHTSISALPDRLNRPGQSLFWREDYLRRFFSWLDNRSTDALKSTRTF
jgi:hypothetical protein